MRRADTDYQTSEVDIDKYLNFDIAIIGGGFFGVYIAEFYALIGKRVALIEMNNDLMQRASYVNQARVHNGYHYPRSILTALRSRISFPRFVDEFQDCISNDFEKYYMTANLLGKVSANQFKKFCDRIGAPCDVAPEKVRKLVNPKLIDAVFSTREYAFDSEKLKKIMIDRIRNAGVQVFYEHSVSKVEYDEKRQLLE
ncbi:FAD-dependent oxidoreductase, partial [Photobacterium sp. OFAV2-7]|uniref:FAD-dependent oxidoreductase n=1 Tax=Photobacterium sp. OFAV2-7 TaxID=2917748 RepID=UPI001EF5AFEB